MLTRCDTYWVQNSGKPLPWAWHSNCSGFSQPMLPASPSSLLRKLCRAATQPNPAPFALSRSTETLRQRLIIPLRTLSERVIKEFERALEQAAEGFRVEQAEGLLDVNPTRWMDFSNAWQCILRDLGRDPARSRVVTWLGDPLLAEQDLAAG